MQSNSRVFTDREALAPKPTGGFDARQSEYTTRGARDPWLKPPHPDSTSQGLDQKDPADERGLMRQRVVEGVGEQFDRPVDLVAGSGPADRKTNRSSDLRRGTADRSKDLSHLIRGVIRTRAGHGQLACSALDFSGTDRKLHRDRIGEPRQAVSEDSWRRINGR